MKKVIENLGGGFKLVVHFVSCGTKFRGSVLMEDCFTCDIEGPDGNLAIGSELYSARVKRLTGATPAPVLIDFENRGGWYYTAAEAAQVGRQLVSIMDDKILSSLSSNLLKAAELIACK